MGTPAEHTAILRYIKTLRAYAREDKLMARVAFNSDWREVARKNRNRRLHEAWFWRRHERELRGQDSVTTILRRAEAVERNRALGQLKDTFRAAVAMEAAE